VFAPCNGGMSQRSISVSQPHGGMRRGTVPWYFHEKPEEALAPEPGIYSNSLPPRKQLSPMQQLVLS